MSTKPPGGTRDFLPADVRRREHVIGVVTRVYERYGFEPLETPAFENIEFCSAVTAKKATSYFQNPASWRHESSGEVIALRYDLTVPLARRRPVSEPAAEAKRYQIQPVWRADRRQGCFPTASSATPDWIDVAGVEAEISAPGRRDLTTLGRFSDSSEPPAAAD